RGGTDDLAQQARLAVNRVERDHDAARLRMHARGGAVVEEADRAVCELARIVLPRGRDARAQREGAPLAAQAPDDRAAARVDVVGGPRVARRDEQAAVAVTRDRVEVEEVKRFTRARAR